MEQPEETQSIQHYIPQMLQVPALIAGLGFFLGSALLLGKGLSFPGLLFGVSISDLISEAIIITPLFASYLFMVVMIGFSVDWILRKIKISRIYYNYGWLCVILALLGAALYNTLIDEFQNSLLYFIFSYIVLSVVIAETRIGVNISLKGIIRAIFLSALIAYILIFIVGAFWVNAMYRKTDDEILERGYSVCVDKCHPGLVLATTGSRVAIRYWRDPHVYYYPISDLKGYVAGMPVKRADTKPRLVRLLMLLGLKN